ALNACERGESPGWNRLDFFAELTPLAAQAGNVHGREIEGGGEMATGFLQAIEDLIHGLEARAGIEQALFLERLGKLADQLAATAHRIRKRREHPDGRGMEGDDAEQFDAVAG